MAKTRGDNRALAMFFMVALLLHVMLLAMPIARDVAQRLESTETLSVVLRQPRRDEPVLPEKRQVVRQQLESLPAAPVPELVPQVAAEPITEEPQPAVSSRALVSRQFLMESEQSEAWLHAIDASRQQPDYQVYERDSLDDVLNQPVLNLPFRDTRVYEIAYYEAGFNGAVDKFWDSVTVPFGFTTKHNTRVQCAWVLIFAGCSWGHKTLFHREADKRKADETQPY